MALVQRVKRVLRNGYATIINDKRPLPAYSYGWLNRLCGTLVAQCHAAEIRPAYAWGVTHAAALARALSEARVSVLEMGVAGGRGLVALEQIAAQVERYIPVGIDVYGFDTGCGLPRPTDFRDHPNLYFSGDYAMDREALLRRLTRAQLQLGDVAETVGPFLARAPAPVGFVSWDFDYYSSTIAAFQLLEAAADVLLPRIVSYFDDIMGLTFGDHVGERAAITEFNATHLARKVSPIYGLRFHLPWPLSVAQWPEMMYLAHLFDHPRYGDADGLIPSGEAPL